MAKKIFIERLRLPFLPALIASFLIGTVLWIIIQKVLYNSVRIAVPSWPFILINYCLPFLFLRIFPFVTTSIKDDTLTVGFSLGRYYLENISLTNSISCEQTEYKCSLIQLFFPTYFRGGDRRKVCLPGYSGDGLLLTYAKDDFFSGARKQVAIVIPTMKAEQLLHLVAPYLSTDNASEKNKGK